MKPKNKVIVTDFSIGSPDSDVEAPPELRGTGKDLQPSKSNVEAAKECKRDSPPPPSGTPPSNESELEHGVEKDNDTLGSKQNSPPPLEMLADDSIHLGSTSTSSPKIVLNESSETTFEFDSLQSSVQPKDIQVAIEMKQRKNAFVGSKQPKKVRHFLSTLPCFHTLDLY